MLGDFLLIMDLLLCCCIVSLGVGNGRPGSADALHAGPGRAHICHCCGLLLGSAVQPQVPRGYEAVVMDFGSARRLPVEVNSRADALALQEEAEVSTRV